MVSEVTRIYIIVGIGTLLQKKYTANLQYVRQNLVCYLKNVSHTRKFCCQNFHLLRRGNFQSLSCDLQLAKTFGITLSPWSNITL